MMGEPSWAPMKDITLGSYGSALWRRALSLSPHRAAVHFHVLGVSGSGKSRFLATLFLAFLRAGLSATLIDPHGDLARLILGHLVADKTFDDPKAFEKILYLDLPAAARQELYLPLNVLRQPVSPHATASNIVEAMHRTWPALGDGAAPMFDTLVQNGVKALVTNNEPLPRLYHFLTDKGYRDRLLDEEADEGVRGVFRDWYDKLSPRDQLDASGSTLRRVNLLSFDPVLTYSLGQKETVLNFREILDQGKSVIINLAIENPEARRLLGSLLTVGAEQGALSRASLPPDQRFGTHFLIIDEFSEFSAQSSEALARMLSQTRKYGLFMVMAHQTVDQVGERLKSALQNVGVDVVFALGPDDANYYARILGHVEPKTVSEQVEEARESVGMSEQWETWRQQLLELYQGQAFVSLRSHHRPPLWRRMTGIYKPHLYRVATPNMPDPKVDPTRLYEIESYYLRTLFTKKEDVPTMVETPPSRVTRF